jgi:biofilm PGA synthesis N-glycosyltransferase PgaC
MMIDIFFIWTSLALFEILLFSSYTLIMLRYSRKEVQFSLPENLPHITVIIPMYNEEKVIEEKIRNTSQFNYPKEKLDILLLDDYSKDKSRQISEEILKDLNYNARIIANEGGKGKARALNWIFPQIINDITLITDADALLEADALHQAVKHFKDPGIGGVTGKIVIISDKARISKSQEEAYRAFYDIWRKGESNLHSVSVCNGPLMCFRTELLQKIKVDPDIYADDSDILFKIIRLGYRVVYEPEAVVYERVPLSMKGRIVQKMKRINGLRKVYFHNLSFIGNGIYGKLIFPYALLTHIISPVIVLVLVILYPLLILQNIFYLIFLIPLIIPKIGNTLFSFIITQLMMNFSFLVKTGGSWEAVKDARYRLQ